MIEFLELMSADARSVALARPFSLQRIFRGAQSLVNGLLMQGGLCIDSFGEDISFLLLEKLIRMQTQHANFQNELLYNKLS